MFQNHFDKVWVINLEKSEDRLAEFKKQAEFIGLEFDVFPAYDGYGNNIRFKENNKEYGWNQGAAGLVKTTIDIINDAKANGYKTVMIFEDDSQFNDTTLNSLNQVMSKVPSNWELIHFCTKHNRPPEWIGKNTARIKSAWMCQAYAISETVYDELLEHFNKMDRPIDAVTAHTIHPKGNSYCSITKAVTHPINFSTIRLKVVDYRFE